MKYPPHINSLSVQSVYIESIFPGEATSSATGFFISLGYCSRVVYLATARHVLHGSDFFTDACSAIPKAIRVWIPLKNRIEWRAFEISLLDENTGSPKWIDHETVKAAAIRQTFPDADIALLPLKIDDSWRDALVIPYVPCRRQFFADWQRSIGMNLYLCGFPLKRTEQKLGVTVTASVASEPNIDFHFRARYYPFYLVSGRFWTGQSGSPVLPWPSVGAGSTEGGDWEYADGAEASVVGLYSGRLELSKNETSDLGIVWHADLLSQLAATYNGEGHSIEWVK